jgi:hypothetical protein
MVTVSNLYRSYRSINFIKQLAARNICNSRKSVVPSGAAVFLNFQIRNSN